MEFITMTVAQVISWLISTGIAAGVAYLLEQFALEEKVKNFLQGLAVAVLIAAVTYLAGYVPQNVMNQQVFQVIAGLVAVLMNMIGSSFGQTHGIAAFTNRVDAVIYLQALLEDVKEEPEQK